MKSRRRSPAFGWFLIGAASVLVTQEAIANFTAPESDALDRAETAETAIRVLAAQRDSAVQRADSLESDATARDTVLVRVVETVRVTIEAATHRFQEADSSFASGVDSLRTMLDSTGVRILDRIVDDHEFAIEQKDVAYRALEVRLGVTEESATLWRSTSEAKGAVIAAQVAELVQYRIANEALHDHIRGQSRENKLLKIGGLVLLTKAAYDQFLSPKKGE